MNMTSDQLTNSHMPIDSSFEGEKVLIDGSSANCVKLNVGGCFFQTTLGTLRRYDCMLRAMFSGRIPVRRDSDGFVLIDRCGKHFGKILNFLRDCTVPLPECQYEVAEILQEAKYYLIQELVDHCVGWLQVIHDARNEPNEFPRVPIVMNEDGVERIVKSCFDRPVIELLMNRQNNKYSYTHQSDENFLRNQEIFDKLVLRINKRVIFVKNMGTGSSEMCRWKFHSSGGKKKTEICCTSIVYATDRKQTKVDFPEARIYEEAMNILLSNDAATVAAAAANCSGGGKTVAAKHCCHHHKSTAAAGYGAAAAAADAVDLESNGFSREFMEQFSLTEATKTAPDSLYSVFVQQSGELLAANAATTAATAAAPLQCDYCGVFPSTSTNAAAAAAAAAAWSVPKLCTAAGAKSASPCDVHAAADAASGSEPFHVYNPSQAHANVTHYVATDRPRYIPPSQRAAHPPTADAAALHSGGGGGAQSAGSSGE